MNLLWEWVELKGGGEKCGGSPSPGSVCVCVWVSWDARWNIPGGFYEGMPLPRILTQAGHFLYTQDGLHQTNIVLGPFLFCFVILHKQREADSFF